MSHSKFPVAIGVCLDAEAIWSDQMAPGEHRPVLLSQGAFAIHEGLTPLLDLFDRHNAATTFYLPGVTADKYPDSVRDIAGRGHEIASHGYNRRATNELSRGAQWEELNDGIDALKKITGVRPTTWRSPSCEFTEHTMDLMLEAGVTVSANYHDRIRPYRHSRDGAPLPIVELPVQRHLADAPYFRYGALPGQTPRPSSAAYDVWSEEFTASYEDVPGAFFHLTLHVQLIGHPGRLRMLDRFLGEIAEQPNAAFMTATQIAATVD
jgi:peptidoglycan/xylan/chitin deacetylase (PgdA/CDA1 family)